MEPFFIDKFFRYVGQVANRFSELSSEKILDAYRREGYGDIEEISDDERRRIRKANSRFYCYCHHANAAKYRCGDFTVCRHGLRMREVKKVRFNGKTLYK